MKRIVREILEIIDCPEAGIPDDIKVNHKDLVAAGELALALDFVEDWIVDNDVRVTTGFYGRILTIRSSWGRRGRAEDYIRKHLLVD